MKKIELQEPSIKFLAKFKKTGTENSILLREAYEEGGRITYSTVTKCRRGMLHGLEGS
jgi:hypothetical protein